MPLPHHDSLQWADHQQSLARTMLNARGDKCDLDYLREMALRRAEEKKAQEAKTVTPEDQATEIKP